MRLTNYRENEETREFTMTVCLSEKEWNRFDVRAFDLISLHDKLKKQTNPRLIQNIIYGHYSLSDSMIEKMADADEVGRVARFVTIRRYCYYFIREYTNLSLQAIGDLYGQDHSTVLFHVKKIQGWLDVDATVVDESEEIRAKIIERINLREE